jgi:ribonuclease Z
VKPTFHPFLVNGPSGDPALYVEWLFERRALLFDLGDIAALAPRKVLRVSDVFVSHTHMDHFVGLDQLVRICLGRPNVVRLFGPEGFLDRVEHRLGGYSWNLVDRYETDFTLIACEVREGAPLQTARFRCRAAFRREPLEPRPWDDGTLLREPGFRVRATVLDHKIPCLAFALEETAHVNVWKNRLEAMGLPTGPWLRALKAAVLRGEPDDTPVRARWREDGRRVERHYALGDLRRELVRVVAGQRLGYVVDAVCHAENTRRITDLISGADTLYIEAAFLAADAALAAEKYHLTAEQAGELARLAGVRAIVPFHYSTRYPGREAELWAEAERAFGEGGRSGTAASGPGQSP